MATYSPDPRRYVGVERTLLELMHVRLTSGQASRLDIPVPNKSAGLTLRARLWALVKAAEGLTSPAVAGRYGLDWEAALALREQAASARQFTTSLQPTNPDNPDGKAAHTLTVLPIVDSTTFSSAADYLVEQLMNTPAGDTNNDN